MDKKQLRNTLMLMACAFIWGTAFVAQSVGSDYMGPYTFLASRSWLACAFLLGLMAVLRKMGKTNPAAEPGFWQNKKVLLRGGIFCGVALFAASAAQQMGIGTTSTAKAGFMTALYVVLVPVAGVFLGSRPGVKLWCCVAASVVGLYLLCLAGRDTLSLTGGEWQLLVCAILFTAQIMLVNHFSPQLDGIQLSFVQFFVVSVLSTIFAFVFEAPSPDQFRAAAVSIAYCGIMSSGVAYTLQIVGQKELDPTIASLAMCLESVFSALAGWLILGETLSATELCGCALMFGAIVVSQLPEKRLKGTAASRELLLSFVHQKKVAKKSPAVADAADPRLRGCTPLRTPKRRSEGAGAKRKQYYFSFLTPPPLPPPLSREFPRTPAGMNGSSVGAAYMPPATYRGNPSTGKGAGCRPPSPLSFATNSQQSVGAGHARPAALLCCPSTG